MLVRDQYGIIGQHDPNNKEYLDMGDAARTMGILSCFGDTTARDIINKHWFRSVRHPYDLKWNDLSLQSRDQQVCLMAGAYAHSIGCARRVCDFRGFTVNKDVLMPDVYMFMQKCLGKDKWYHYILGVPWLFVSIFYTCVVDSKHELNQLACICRVMGKGWLKLLVNMHPGYVENFQQYWAGWRDQKEVGSYVVFATADIIMEHRL